VRRLIAAFYESTATKAAALEAMWRTRDSAYESYMSPNLRHDNLDIRREAVHGVAVYPISSSAIELVPLFEDAELREEALFAYAIAAPAKVNPKSMLRFFDEIERKAGGFDAGEYHTVATALDRRLEIEEFDPVFLPGEEGEGEDLISAPAGTKVGRNDPCPCGSGKKHKKCCGA